MKKVFGHENLVVDLSNNEQLVFSIDDSAVEPSDK